MANIKVQGSGATGTDGNDLIFGSQDADSIRGLFGDDQIHGGRGNDFLTGDYGAGIRPLILVGGDDRLNGGPGDDFLNGDHGDDVLLGGPGNDLFFFGSRSYFGLYPRGHDTILDFKQGADQISLDVPFSFVDTNGNGVLDNDDGPVDVSHGRTELEFGDTGVLTILGETHLTASDFIFFR